MKSNPVRRRFRLFRKGAYGTFYVEDSVTRQQSSLRTRDRKEAERLCQARCEAAEAPDRAFRVGMAYVGTTDPEAGTRTWRHVVDAYAHMHPVGSPTRHRILSAGKDRALVPLLRLPLLRTRPDDILAAVACGKVSTNAYLRRFHNLALDLGWLARAILPRRRWPKVRHLPKRAITEEEHLRIVQREGNPERRAFYWLCWHLGGASSDVAGLMAEDIDWTRRTLSYQRRKTARVSGIRFGPACEAILRQLPSSGPLFPYLNSVRAGDRATEFRQRCRGLGIEGVTLHSYRYSWAERAKLAGMSERHAQAALGHASKAVHRAYAKGAILEIPCLEDMLPPSRSSPSATEPSPTPSLPGASVPCMAPPPDDTPPSRPLHAGEVNMIAA